MRRKYMAALCCLVLGALAAHAQTDLNPDAMFDDPSALTATQATQVKKDQQNDFLQSTGAAVGGIFTGQFISSWSWQNGVPQGLQAPNTSTFTPDLEADIWIDSRPQKDFRVFGKGTVEYPFSGVDSNGLQDVRMDELFTDFTLGIIQVRAGKQNIKTGVGYFFSPADVFSLNTIDLSNPTKDLEGPLAIKAQISSGTTNWYLYADMNDVSAPSDIVWVPRLEFVLGNWELGWESYLGAGKAPRLINTTTTSVGDFSLFGEAVLSYGSDKTFVVKDGLAPGGFQTQTYNNTFYFQGTAGFKYDNSELDFVTISIRAQYYYNGQGYTDDTELGNAIALEGSGLSSLTVSDLTYWGVHNAAVSCDFSKIDKGDFGLRGLWVADLSDGSGYIYPRVYFKYGNNFCLSLGPQWNYGPSSSYYSYNGDKFSLNLEVDVGGGGMLPMGDF